MRQWNKEEKERILNFEQCETVCFKEKKGLRIGAGYTSSNTPFVYNRKNYECVEEGRKIWNPATFFHSLIISSLIDNRKPDTFFFQNF